MDAAPFCWALQRCWGLEALGHTGTVSALLRALNHPGESHCCSSAGRPPSHHPGDIPVLGSLSLLSWVCPADTSMPSAGLWLSMLVCVSMLCTCFLIYICRMDWRKAAEEVTVCCTTRWDGMAKPRALCVGPWMLLHIPLPPSMRLEMPRYANSSEVPTSHQLWGTGDILYCAISGHTKHTQALQVGIPPLLSPAAPPGSAPCRSDPTAARGAAPEPRAPQQGAVPGAPHSPPCCSGAGLRRYGRGGG